MAQQGVLPSPPATDTAELHFKLVKRCNAVSYTKEAPWANAIAVANSMGLTFIGMKGGFIIARTNELISDAFARKFQHVRCGLVTHLAVNSDETLLACGGNQSPEGSVLYLYYTNRIPTQSSLLGYHKVNLPATAVLCDLVWNPAMPQLLSACLSDGSVIVAEFKSDSAKDLVSIPPAAGARCLCWSPKGKQIVVGSEDGKLTQYKPDLKPAKALQAPELFGGAVAVVNVLWISNFQFAAFYRNRNQHDISPVLVIINAGKNEPVTFINYDDVTYGSTGNRMPQFYFYHQPQWNMILISSANSVELAVLHLAEDGKTWQQWVIGESSRAEMPLSAENEETFPVGMAVDLSSHARVPWPQAETELPPMPRLLLLSHEGRLCLYNVISLRADTPAICSAPTLAVLDSFFDMPLAPAEKPKAALLETPMPQKAVPADEKTFHPVPVPAAAVEHQKTPQTPQTVAQPQEPQPTLPQVILSVPTPVPTLTPVPRPPPPVQKDQTPPPASQPAAARTTPDPPLQSPPGEHEADDQVDEAVYDAAIVDEVSALNEHLNVLHLEMAKEDVELGPVEIFSGTVKRLEVLTEFQKDVEETTVSQAEEVAELKLEALELTAKTEDARLVNSRRGNILTTQLRRSQQLDPVMARTLREVLTLRTYIENQLAQITEHLQQKWEEYQRSCRKDAKDRMETPLMEDIYKTLDLHKKLLCRQKLDLDRLQKEMELRTPRAGFSAAVPKPALRHQDSSRSADLSKLADSLLGLSIKKEEVMPKQVNDLLIEAKRQNAGSAALSANDVTLLLDRFEDAEIPQVSHALSFAERQAHKKEVATRLKNAAERIKKKEEAKIAKAKKSSPHTEPAKVQLPSVPFVVSPASVSAAFAKSESLTSSPATSAFVTATGKDKPFSSVFPVSSKAAFTQGTSTAAKVPVPQQSTFSGNKGVATSFPAETYKPFATISTPSMSSHQPLSGTKRSTSSSENTIPAVTSATTPVSTDSTDRKSANLPTVISSPYFSTGTPTTASAFSAFGSSSLFGAKGTPSATPTSLFGSSGSAGLFGSSGSQADKPLISSSNIFGSSGSPAATGDKQPTSSNIFGSSVPPASTTGTQSTGLFGSLGLQSATTAAAAGAVTTATGAVGKLPSTTSIFGSSGSSFGGPSVFGGTATTAPTSNLFGASTATAPTSNLFGASTTQVASKPGKAGGNGDAVSTGFSFSVALSATSTAPNTSSVEATAQAKPSLAVTAVSPADSPPPPPPDISSSDQGDSTPSSASLAKPTAPEAPADKPPSTSAPPPQGQLVTSPSSFTTPTPSLLASASPFTPSTSGLFGAVTAASTPTGPFASVTSPATSSTNLFGSTTPGSTGLCTSVTSSAPVTPSAGLFGAPTSTSAALTASPGLFGSTPGTTGLFGTASPVATSASPGLFASVPASKSEGSGMFGTPSTAVTIAGTAAFGAATTVSSAASPGLFAAVTSASTSSPGLFGAVSSSSGSSPGLFGSVPVPPTNASPFGTSIFGAATTSGGLFGSAFGPATTTASAGVFGSSTTASSPSAFGADLNQTANLFGQMLGGPASPSTPQGSIFETPKKSFDSGGSIFGSNTTASAGFGAPATNVFGQSASPGLFGSSPATTSIFGQTPATTASSFMGQNICSPFSSGSAAPNQSPFGSTASTTQSVFGSSTPAFGQNAFGQSSSASIFGGSGSPANTGSSIFGSGTSGGSFSSGSFAGGPFSGGSGSVAQTGFGSTAFSKPAVGGFGSAPVFGGAPAPPAFGGTAAFGAPSAFGNPSKVFGTPAGSSGPAFGQSTAAAGFESLAGQNTVGFGNLAQMTGGQQAFGSGFAAPQQSAFGAQQPQQPAPSSFGGNSFSSWR